jgi:hypothetical protein
MAAANQYDAVTESLKTHRGLCHNRTGRSCTRAGRGHRSEETSPMRAYVFSLGRA